jgi:hypothetical protein
MFNSLFLRNLLVAGTLCCTIQALPCQAEPPSPLSALLAISGDWYPDPKASEAAKQWKITGNSLQVTIPAQDTKPYTVLRRESLPPGDWTADLWLVEYDVEQQARYTLCLAGAAHDPRKLRIQVDFPGNSWNHEDLLAYIAGENAKNQYDASIQSSSHLVSGVSPVLWLRVSYNASKKRCTFEMNGEEAGTLSTSDFVPCGQPSLQIQTTYASQRQTIVEMAGFSVTPSDVLTPMEGAENEPKGLAFLGWQRLAVPKKISLPSNLAATLVSLEASPELSVRGHAYALAARLLTVRAKEGKIGSALWAQTAQFVSASLPNDREGLSVLLPVAAASADAVQQSQVQPWVSQYFASQPAAVQYSEFSMRYLTERAVLLDPSRTVLAVSSEAMNPARGLAEDLAMTAPNKSLASYCDVLSQENSSRNPGALAYMLPELKRVAPNYAALAVRYLKSLESLRGDSLYNQMIGEPDRTYSFAAYRLAPVDFSEAMSFWGRIQTPDVKAHTLEYMTQALSDGKQRVVSDLTETTLKSSVAEWKPASSGDTPVPQIVRLAQWYWKQGDRSKAAAMLLLAEAKIGVTPATQFRDTWAITLLIKDLGLPELESWRQKSAQAALALDVVHGGDYSPMGGVNSSATLRVSQELANSGRPDDALALLKKLNQAEWPNNYAVGVAFIIQNLAVKQPERALSLLPEVPEGVQKNYLFRKLLPLIAKRNLSKALTLLNNIPEAERGVAALNIAAVLSPDDFPRLHALVGNAISAHIKQWQTTVRDSGTHSQLSEGLSKLPVSSLLSLQPFFASDQDWYSYLLLAATARACGLQSDPIWRHISGTAWTRYDALPYAPTDLKYVIWSEDHSKELSEEQE